MTRSLATANHADATSAFDTRLLGVSGLLFVASAATTIAWCGSMSAMDMAMPGGWTMSMAWMRMPDQTWSGAAASFVGMWSVMMVAMMLPALVPMLQRYAEAVAELKTAAAVDDPDGVILDHLGDALYKSGDGPAAVTAWKRAVEALEKANEIDKAKIVAEKIIKVK